MRQTKLDEAVEYMHAALEAMREANRDGEDTRSRELSTAITQTETGLLWLENARAGGGIVGEPVTG